MAVRTRASAPSCHRGVWGDGLEWASRSECSLWGTAELRRARQGPGRGSPEGARADGQAAFSPGWSTGWQAFQNIHEVPTSDGTCDRTRLVTPTSSSLLSLVAHPSCPLGLSPALTQDSSRHQPPPQSDLGPPLRVHTSCLSELGRRGRVEQPAWALCSLLCFGSLNYSSLYSKQPELRIQDSCFLRLPTEPRARQWSVMDVT